MVVENGNRVLFLLKVKEGCDSISEVILHYGEESAKRVMIDVRQIMDGEWRREGRQRGVAEEGNISSGWAGFS